MTALQTLDIVECLPIMYKAFKEKRLSAQQSHSEGCKYLDPKGFKCIVGQCLTDETIRALIELEMNGSGIANLVREGKIAISRGMPQDFRDLQNVHDSCRKENLEEKLNLSFATIAKIYQIDLTV